MITRAEMVNFFWREDIDSLAFHVEGHRGLCVIHRRAFRVLLGFLPERQDCCAYFEAQRYAFERAAIDKIAGAGVLPDGNFHLNSRDITKAKSLLYRSAR